MSVGFRAYQRAERVDEALRCELAALRTPDLSDAMRGGYTMSGIAAVYPDVPAVAGSAVTVSASNGGFAIVKLALEICRPGDVLVVAARGRTGAALWGGNLSLGAQRRGVSAFVIDGAIRDVDEIRQLGFPVFARGIATGADSIYAPYGEVNVPIACAGVVVHPGDVIVADADGVVCVRPADAAAVISATRAIMSGHAAAQPMLQRGEVTKYAEIEQSLRNDGLSVVERAWR